MGRGHPFFGLEVFDNARQPHLGVNDEPIDRMYRASLWHSFDRRARECRRLLQDRGRTEGLCGPTGRTSSKSSCCTKTNKSKWRREPRWCAALNRPSCPHFGHRGPCIALRVQALVFRC
jgi:hypothetical protein